MKNSTRAHACVSLIHSDLHSNCLLLLAFTSISCAPHHWECVGIAHVHLADGDRWLVRRRAENRWPQRRKQFIVHNPCFDSHNMASQFFFFSLTGQMTTSSCNEFSVSSKCLHCGGADLTVSACARFLRALRILCQAMANEAQELADESS